jgi:hypothetical protein
MSNEIQQYHAPAPVTFEQLTRMASALSKSGLFAVKTPEAALTLLLIAQAEGIPPTQAMMDYDVIQGRPALKSSAMLARFQRSGGRVQWITSTDECVEGKFVHPVGGELTVKWDSTRLKTAGLDKKEMHQKFPLQMKRARCISEAVRALNPQCIPVGMYAVEEARDIPEEIDVTPRQSLDQAATDAVAAVDHALPPEELDALILTMDVKTMAELTPAFGRAYTRAKEACDEAAKTKLKAIYDDMKAGIEAGAI